MHQNFDTVINEWEGIVKLFIEPVGMIAANIIGIPFDSSSSRSSSRPEKVRSPVLKVKEKGILEALFKRRKR
jgi:hypothetical protein